MTEDNSLPSLAVKSCLKLLKAVKSCQKLSNHHSHAHSQAFIQALSQALKWALRSSQGLRRACFILLVLPDKLFNLYTMTNIGFDKPVAKFQSQTKSNTKGKKNLASGLSLKSYFELVTLKHTQLPSQSIVPIDYESIWILDRGSIRSSPRYIYGPYSSH